MGKINEVIRNTKDGRSLTLSSPEPGEGDELLNIVIEIIQHSPHMLTTPEEFNLTSQQEEDVIKRHLDHPDKVIIVPRIDGKIVGMMDFSAGTRKRNRHQGEFGMSVHPDYQNQGIGRMMLECLIDWVASHPNLEIIRLKVHSRNSKAINLYQSIGFIQEGCEIKGVKLGPNEYDNVVMMSLVVK